MFKTSTPKIPKVGGICTSTNRYKNECPSLIGTTVEACSSSPHTYLHVLKVITLTLCRLTTVCACS